MSAPDVGHTPGPWYVTGSSPEGCVYSSEHELIVPWSPLQSDRKMANARLIAAAPEMAEFIRALNHVGSDEGYCICPANDGTTVDRFHATICVMARGLLARLDGSK